MKRAITIFMVLVLLPSVYSIALNIPNEKHIIFAPNAQKSLSYAAGNTGPGQTTVQVSISAPAGIEVNEPQRTLTLGPYATIPFRVDFKFPPQLAQGLYTLSVDASEVAIGGGMSGLTGVTDTINIISPYPQGYPYASLAVAQYQPAKAPLTVRIPVQNIGYSTLGHLETQIALTLEGNSVKQQKTNTLDALQSFQSAMLETTFETTDLTPGAYSVEAKLGDKLLSQNIVIGEPEIKVVSIDPLKAAEENQFSIKLRVDNWASQIQDALVQVTVHGLLHSEQRTKLVPGENTLTFSATAIPGVSGKYKGNVNIFANLVRKTAKFEVEVQGSQAGTGGLGFKSTKPEEEIPAGKAAELAQETKGSKTNMFLFVMLIASIGVFAFALGRYFKGRKNEPQIPAP